MTNEEAVEYIKKNCYSDWCEKEWHNAINMAIEALEKQIPMKPGYTRLMYKCNGEDIEINHPECPYCRTHGLSLWDAAIPVGDSFCKRCGQKIDWEGEE